MPNLTNHDKADWFIDYVAEGDAGRHYRVELAEDDGAVRDYWFYYVEAARSFVRYEVFGEDVVF